MVRDIFYFTKKEQLQLIKLLIIVCCALCLHQFINTDNDFKIQELSIEAIRIEKIVEKNKKPNIPKKTVSLHSFNPNTVTKSQLEAMNLPKKGIKSLLNYRQKGGTIKDIHGFKRMYGFENLSDSLLIQYLDFGTINFEHPIVEKYKKESSENIPQTKTRINAADSGNYKSTFKHYSTPYIEHPSPQEKLFIGINSADTSTLQKLKGIGPLRAKMIVKFRNALGGYHSLLQLNEVHYLPDSIIKTISDQIYLDSIPIKKINMNQATEKELALHPYINWQEAKMLYNFTKEHGPIRDFSKLNELRGLDSSFINRIKPYLDIDE